MKDHDPFRRNLLLGAAAAGVAAAGSASAQTCTTDAGPHLLDGQPMPEPPRMAATGRHFARGGLPRFGCSEYDHRSRI